MNNRKECAEYFKSRKEFARCFLEFRRKWKTYGRIAGMVVLKESSEEERKAVSGIVGRSFYESDIRFRVAEFEQGLQKTRFAPVDFKELLDEYFGEELLTNQEKRDAVQNQKEQFWNRMLERFSVAEFALEDDSMKSSAARELPSPSEAASPALFWLHAMMSEKKYGWQIVMQEYGREEAAAKLLVWNVGKVLLKLYETGYSPAEPVEDCKRPALDKSGLQLKTEISWPLAVLAAEISGNPHYFDRGLAAGQLLIQAICCVTQSDLPENAWQWRELLLENGIIPDNISSLVHCFGLHLQIEGRWHPAYEVFCDRQEPFALTMENLRGLTGAFAEGKQVYIVENEMVFSYLLEQLKNVKKTILCTSGQPRTAALKLIEALLKSGVEIFYSGDLDPDGIRIADSLWKRFNGKIQIWRMAPEDYEKSLSAEAIGKNGIAKINAIAHPILRETAEYVCQKQLAGYQENILDEMVGDIRKK